MLNSAKAKAQPSLVSEYVDTINSVFFWAETEELMSGIADELKSILTEEN